MSSDHAPDRVLPDGLPFSRAERQADAPWPAADQPPADHDQPLTARTPRLRRRLGRALCIGIDDYPDTPLQSSVSDSREWAKTLAELGFAVTLLNDAEATLEGMASAIAQLLEDTPDQRQAVIQFSGLGCQRAGPGEDLLAPGGQFLQAALVPVDHASAGCLLESTLQQLLLPHAARLRLTLFIDSSYPRSLHRFVPAGGPPAGGQQHARFLPTFGVEKGGERRPISEHPLRDGLARIGEPLPWVQLVASADNQFAFETSQHGVFSAAALRLLPRAMTEGWTPDRFLATLRRALGGGSQTPQLLPMLAQLHQEPLLDAGQHHGANTIGAVPIGRRAGVESMSLRELIRAVDALAADTGTDRPHNES